MLLLTPFKSQFTLSSRSGERPSGSWVRKQAVNVFNSLTRLLSWIAKRPNGLWKAPLFKTSILYYDQQWPTDINVARVYIIFLSNCHTFPYLRSVVSYKSLWMTNHLSRTGKKQLPGSVLKLFSSRSILESVFAQSISVTWRMVPHYDGSSYKNLRGICAITWSLVT